MSDSEEEPQLPCSAARWVPDKTYRYELQEIRDGHVFAWQVTPSLQAQYLICVICHKAYHNLFPVTKDRDPAG
jgi:hypothetical protein